MGVDKDREQDELIRQNAEHIRRNEESILRQTEALEKIRDHYFPRKTLWKQFCGFFLKAVGAVTVAAGLLETGDWYLNERESESMAAESARVAKRLFLRENDIAGATRFLEKAVELDSRSKYRIALAYVKGFAAIADLIDLGRPLTDAERARVDEILAEAVFLQEVAPEEPMPHVLAARALLLRGEVAAAVSSAARAVEMAPDNVQVRIAACAMCFANGNVADARQHLAEAERVNPDFPLVLFWKSQLALTTDRDPKAALAFINALIARAPKLPLAHLQKGGVLLAEKPCDCARVRASLEQALALSPNQTRAMVLMAEAYVREGNVTLARLWLDRTIAKDPNCMAARVARARLGGSEAVADLTYAISLAPLRADLYRLRAAAYKSDGDSQSAAKDIKTADALVDAASRRVGEKGNPL